MSIGLTPKVHHGICAMERLSMRRSRRWLAGPSAGQTGWPTGWRARWPAAVGFSSSAAGMERGTGWGECYRVGDDERGRERWTEHCASDLLCSCLGILNKHIHILAVSPTLLPSCQADQVKAHRGGLRQPNSVGATFFRSTICFTQLSKEIKIKISGKNLVTRSAKPG